MSYGGHFFDTQIREIINIFTPNYSQYFSVIFFLNWYYFPERVVPGNLGRRDLLDAYGQNCETSCERREQKFFSITPVRLASNAFQSISCSQSVINRQLRDSLDPEALGVNCPSCPPLGGPAGNDLNGAGYRKFRYLVLPLWCCGKFCQSSTSGMQRDGRVVHSWNKILAIFLT